MFVRIRSVTIFFWENFSDPDFLQNFSEPVNLKKRFQKLFFKKISSLITGNFFRTVKKNR